MKSSFILLIALVVSIPTIASAFGGRSFSDGLFFGVDLDRNERIDRDEAKNAFNLAEDRIFSRYDKDGSGSINQIEFNEFIQQSPWTDG